MKINARKEAGLADPTTNLFLEVDIFIPQLNLAFEFQVPPHPPPPLLSVSPISLLTQSTKQHRKNIITPIVYIFFTMLTK